MLNQCLMTRNLGSGHLVRPVLSFNFQPTSTIEDTIRCPWVSWNLRSSPTPVITQFVASNSTLAEKRWAHSKDLYTLRGSIPRHPEQRIGTEKINKMVTTKADM